MLEDEVHRSDRKWSVCDRDPSYGAAVGVVGVALAALDGTGASGVGVSTVASGGTVAPGEVSSFFSSHWVYRLVPRAVNCAMTAFTFASVSLSVASLSCAAFTCSCHLIDEAPDIIRRLRGIVHLHDSRMQFPSLRIDGHVALITGTGTGSGQASALALAAAGATVVCTELPHLLAAAETTARTAARDYGVEVKAIALDVTRLDLIEVAVAQAHEAFGRIDILVSQAVGRGMIARRHGKIISIASQMGVNGYERRAAYCGKAGVISHGRSPWSGRAMACR